MKVSTERHKAIDEAAGDWLARRDSGNWSDELERRFQEWLDESLLHRVAYLRLEHVWERSERLKALGAGIPPGVIPPANGWNLSFLFEQRDGASDPESSGADAAPSALEESSGPGTALPSAIAGASKKLDHRRTPLTPVRRRLLAFAASVLIAAALGLAYHLWPSGTSYRTPVGGLASVPMADGSKITLNTDSEVRVAVTEKERRVELEQGEAFFEVAKDPARPFIVSAGNKRVIAVGTKFSVRREGSDIQVVVTEGKVRVEARGNSGSGITEPLTAGTVAQASDTGVLLRTQNLEEAEESLSWRQQVLIFRQMTLGDASAEFNRYNTRKIVIEDPSVAALQIAGTFRADNVEAFVRLLERGYPVRVEERDDQLVLMPR